MTRDMSKENWMEMLEKAKQTSGFSFDNVNRTAFAVLDGCCDEEEHDSLLREISDLAPAGLNMYARLQLSVLLLCLLVKQSRFDLKRNLHKESEEAAATFRAMIESLKPIHKLHVDYTLGNIISVDSHQLPPLTFKLKKNSRYYVCGEVVDMKDFHTLKNPKWLNDKVINAYLALLQREHNLKNTDHIFALPSYMEVLWGHIELIKIIRWRYMTIRSEKTGELGNRKWQTGDLVSSRQKDGNACGSFVMLNALVLSKNLDLKDVSHPLSLRMREFVRCKLLSASDEPPSQRSRCDMVG
ncbi:hypothetical protein KP79_PYT01030 [Mizuhopecten yessoensis]|uniref:Ubiquitin-like protease family profile domain-containing protein n=1 Tax=Mizuhopecten yessoensis TaxID=6573 RepID=A0A210QLM9_MIZYE|nr:hypothetical protein KP79_PYT01030 [Mizuhopecten yessoensis]